MGEAGRPGQGLLDPLGAARAVENLADVALGAAEGAGDLGGGGTPLADEGSDVPDSHRR